MINEVCGYTSTGKICAELAEKYEAGGHTVKIAFGRSSYVPERYKKYAVQIGSSWDVRFQALQTRLFDTHGFGNKKATEKFLIWAEKYHPDMIWLHNLHGYYINVEMLFAWMKSHSEWKVRWTLHDCWPFTGHCVYFTMAKCERWRNGCFQCPQKREYPASLFWDNSKNNYARKKQAFTGVKNLQIITPSDWLASLVKMSFLSSYPVRVRHNTIDRTVFKPINSDFRKKYGLEDKIIILGAANAWEKQKRKGFDDFLELVRMLDEKYVIVLIGVAGKTIRKLPKDIRKLCCIRNLGKLEKYPLPVNEKNNSNMKAGAAVPEGVENLYKEITGEIYTRREDTHSVLYCFPKTKNKEEMAMLYSAADFFVNPSHEDNFPTTNLEAHACGTFVITYDVGGCRETLNERTGKTGEHDYLPFVPEWNL